MDIEGRERLASKDGIEIEIAKLTEGIDGKLSDGKPGIVSVGRESDASKEGSGIEMLNETLGMLGKDSDGRPGMDIVGKLQLTR